jgi:DNA-directed RNA polymerase subunit RPC12/RpoP
MMKTSESIVEAAYHVVKWYSEMLERVPIKEEFEGVEAVLAQHFASLPTSTARAAAEEIALLQWLHMKTGVELREDEINKLTTIILTHCAGPDAAPSYVVNCQSCGFKVELFPTPAASVTKCVKCGHVKQMSSVAGTDGICCHYGNEIGTLCGCKCDFSNEGD